jgi:hypothetical protein
MKILKTISLVLLMAMSIASAKAQAASNNIDKITGAYLGVKDALVASDGTATQGKAKELFALLSAQPDKGLNTAQQKVLAGYIDKLKYDSRHMSETTTVDHQREHFASLSKNMYEVLKRLKLNTTTLYEQYCPDKDSYWLSESSAIKNPYWGKVMLTCGTVKETLVAVKK